MRRFAFLVLLLVLGVGAYVVLARGKELPQPAPTSPAPVPAAEPAAEPPPRLAPPPARIDGGLGANKVKASDEAELMRGIRENVRSDPKLAETLAREGRRRFGDSADSDERDALLVDALINQQHIGAARSETYYYLGHHPQGRYTAHLLAMTGVHPMPQPPAQR
ncbi:MAG: hypothetical protein ABSB49_22745 [Polyangia bacterium]|jgi:hypothetical protein